MIKFLNSESASHVCGCSGCTSCASLGAHYISVNGVKYFTSFMCREGDNLPFLLLSGETAENIESGETRWILWD